VTANLREMIAATEADRRPGDLAPRVYNLRMTDKIRPGSILLCLAAVLLLGLAVAQGYVSWRAQYEFIFAAKRASVPAALEAVGLDTGAVIFALLGLAHARMGRPARIERALNLACAFGSMTMNLLGADLASPRSVAVYILPALLYAACSDRLIATAGHAAGVSETSVWRAGGLVLLYGLRACVALPSTARGLRQRLLDLTPLPAPPTAKKPAIAAGPRPVRGRAGETKKAHLLRLYAGHPDHGDRSKVSRIAAELGPQAKLDPRTARSYLYAAVDGAQS
jgi:hypothetical protein